MIRFMNAFVKITGWLPYFLVFRTRVLYEDKKAQSRKIKGSAIIVSNHTSVWDYACYLYVFWRRTLRVLAAEILYEKKKLGPFLNAMGAIYVNRDTRDFSFIDKSNKILSKGGVILAFPESRIPLKDEATPLEFKPSIAYLSILSQKTIVPVYTDGNYFSWKRARVLIGKPLEVASLMDPKLSEEENITLVNTKLREKIIELRELYEQKTKKR